MKDEINKICTELNDGKIAVVQANEQLFDLFGVSQQRELLKALQGIIQCCDGNEPTHEQIYYIAKDAIKVFNCG
jgi:hypothetical protein